MVVVLAIDMGEHVQPTQAQCQHAFQMVEEGDPNAALLCVGEVDVAGDTAEQAGTDQQRIVLQPLQQMGGVFATVGAGLWISILAGLDLPVMGISTAGDEADEGQQGFDSFS